MSEQLQQLLESIERALTHWAAGPSHPAVLRIIEVRQEGSQLVVDSEKAVGVPLSGMLRQQRVVSFDDTIESLRPLAAAIEHAVENRLPALDLAATSVIVRLSQNYPVDETLLTKAPPLALTILNQIIDSREGKTAIFNPLSVDPDSIESQSREQGVASLAALAYELLSGRHAPTGKAEHRPPIAALSEAGNLCLRRAFEQSSSFATAANFIDELATGGRSTRGHEPATPL